MNRLVIPLAVLGMAGLVFLIIGDVGFRAPERSDMAAVDAAPPPPPRPKPQPVLVMDAGLPADMSVPDDTPSVETLREFGVFGRDAQFLDEFLKQDFKRVADKGGPTFVNGEGTQLTLRVEGGRVTGARADFTDKALSATMTGLTWIFSGRRDHIPLHWEGQTPGEAYAGQFKDRYGRVFHYRGALHTSGQEGLYGPAWLELSTRPFAEK